MQLTNPASTPRVKNRKHPAMDRVMEALRAT